jgi:hypothetical protein
VQSVRPVHQVRRREYEPSRQHGAGCERLSPSIAQDASRQALAARSVTRAGEDLVRPSSMIARDALRFAMTLPSPKAVGKSRSRIPLSPPPRMGSGAEELQIRSVLEDQHAPAPQDLRRAMGWNKKLGQLLNARTAIDSRPLSESGGSDPSLIRRCGSSALRHAGRSRSGSGPRGPGPSRGPRTVVK